MEQGSQEWFEARLGKVTASKIKDVMSKGRGNAESKTRRSYLIQLLSERLTNEVQESYQNTAMQWGADQEPNARECYEFEHNLTVGQVGFVDHPVIENYGASPDGMVGINGLIEIKCPNTSTHLEWKIAGVVPSEHIKQIQAQLDCTGRQWCDFVSYDPRLPVNIQMFVIRIDRDNDLISEIQEAVKTINSDVVSLIEKLTA